MTNAYTVSRTPMSKLEEVWLKSRGSAASHLRIHQCLARFFAIVETDKPNLDNELDGLFQRLGEQLQMSGKEVRWTFKMAKEEGVLSVSARLAPAIATDLELKLVNFRRKLEYEQMLTKHKQSLSDRLSKPLPFDSGHLNRPEFDSTTTPSLRIIVGEVRSRYLPQKEDRVDAVAEAAADYFVNVVPQSCRADEEDQKYTSGWIGVSGGNTMLNVVQRIEAKKARFEQLTLIPLAGEAEPDKFEISANSVVLRLGQVCVPGTAHRYSLMTTPIVADDAEQIEKLRQSQVRSPGIERVIELARHVKFAFTGIGEAGVDPPKDDDTTPTIGLTKDGNRKDDNRQEPALERLRIHCAIPRPTENVVGDICYRPINAMGKEAWKGLSDRLIGPSLDDIKKMAGDPAGRRVFAVACGSDKVGPIIAAVRGGLVNGLITDELTALEILKDLETHAKELQGRIEDLQKKIENLEERTKKPKNTSEKRRLGGDASVEGSEPAL